MGIDEAGRGCVIGPLVIGAIIWPSSYLTDLETLGVKDSKEFVSKREKLLRKEIAEKLQKKATKTPIALIEPEKIDLVLQEKKLATARVSSKKYTGNNLNFLEMHEMAQCILQNPCKTVFIDSLSTPTYFLLHLKKMLQDNIIQPVLDVQMNLTENMIKVKWKHLDLHTLDSTIIIAKNKGDKLFPVVSAASIIAKVRRDKIIREIEINHGIPTNLLASGYANDQLLPFLDEYKQKIYERQFSFIRYEWEWEPLQKIINHDKHKRKQTSLLDSVKM